MNPRLAACLLGLGLAGAVPLCAQPAGQVKGEFKLPFFTDGRLASQLTGTGAEFQKDGTVLLKTARVEHYDAKGNSNATVVVSATNCVVTRSLVWSREGLKIATADGQFVLTGEGFGWWHSSSELVVSNQIATTFRKSDGRQPALPADLLNIQADSLRLNYASNMVTFTGRVQADDSEFEVTCGNLSVRRSGSGRFDRLLAWPDVAMLSRRDGSRVTSERAEYVLATAGELVELTGNPHWRETLREAKADRFELRRPASKQEPQVLQAIGHAWIKMPAATNAAAGFTLQQTPPSPAPSNATRVFELSAGIVTLVMPLTNGPVQGVEAATNVVITDPQAGWRATAGRAVFTNATLELTGSPEWNEGDRLVRGDTLTLTTSPQSFAATGHAHMQFPVQLATNAVPGLGRTARPGRSFGTNLLVSVDADRAIFRDGKLVFHAPVEARLHAGDKPLGRLLCRDLTISYPGHVEAAQAEGDVRIEQFATATEGGTSREIRCERLRVDFDAAGQPRSLAAEGGVDGRQTETHAKRPEPVVTTVRADRLDARFIAGTNHIEIATAAGGVELQQAGRKATGQQAVFTGADGCVTLTGTPRVETPEGRIADTTSLTYDTRQKRFRGQGPFRIEWTRVPTNFGMPTNFTRLKNKFLPAK